MASEASVVYSCFACDFQSLQEENVVHHINNQHVVISGAGDSSEAVDNTESDPLNVSASSNKEDDWGEEQTSFILAKYELYLPLIGPKKKFKTKAKMWTTIAEELLQVLNFVKTPSQVENRYKTVLRRKKKAVDNNSTSGSSRMTVPYENELRKIAAIDDNIEPEVLRSAQGLRHLKEVPMNHSIQPKAVKCSTVQQTLRELHKEKERAKAKRHAEKLDLIREIFKIKKKDHATDEDE